MTANPPSYQDATRRDPLPLIASHLSGADLARCSRVSNAWYAALAPALYGHPMRHYYHCTDEDAAAYIADECCRLIQSLSYICRPSTRALVHTLHIPPDSESHRLDDSLNLWRCLSLLPNLQALVASNSSLLDHNALTQLSTGAAAKLRLLIARNCHNATEYGLLKLLSCTPQLQYLDLSYSNAAGAASVIDLISRLRELRILRLRQTGVGSRVAPSLMSALFNQQRNTRSRLCSLDIRDNNVDFSRLPKPPIVSQNAGLGQAQYWTNHDAHKYEVTVQNQLMDLNLLGEELLQPESEGLTHLYLPRNSNVIDEAFVGVFESIKPRVLDFVVDGSWPSPEIELRTKIWRTIYGKSGHLVSLNLSVTDLSLISSISLENSESELSEMHSDSPPSYERATNQQHSSSRRPHSFLCAFPRLERLTVAGIPQYTTDRQLLFTLERLLAAYGMAAIETENQAELKKTQKNASQFEVITRHEHISCRLKEIILELNGDSKSQPRRSDDHHNEGDPNLDVETLRLALQDDFSFFDDEKESTPVKSQLARLTPAAGTSVTPVDVVHHLARWRQVRREAWKDRSQLGDSRRIALAAEYWPGKVSITRRLSGTLVQDPSDAFSWIANAR